MTLPEHIQIGRMARIAFEQISSDLGECDPSDAFQAVLGHLQSLHPNDARFRSPVSKDIRQIILKECEP